jgi:hypothetical protein
MRLHPISTLALLAALSMPVAGYAQTTDQQQPAAQGQSGTEQPVVEGQDTTQTQAPAAAESTETQAPAAPDSTEAPAQTAEQPAAPNAIQGLITMQDENTFMGSKLMNATVYSPQNEAIGDVNDVILTRDGAVDGVVVGVGGFLGIGEKDVAIKMDRIKLTETDNGVQLVLEATKEELAAAPEFTSKDDVKAAADAQNSQTQTQGLNAPEQPAIPEQPAVQPPAATGDGSTEAPATGSGTNSSQ